MINSIETLATNTIYAHLNHLHHPLPLYSLEDFTEITTLFEQILNNYKDNAPKRTVKAQKVYLYEWVKSIYEILDNPDMYINSANSEQFQKDSARFISTILKVIEQKKAFFHQLSETQKKAMITERLALDNAKKDNAEIRNNYLSKPKPEKAVITDQELMELYPKDYSMKMTCSDLRRKIDHLESRNITFTYIQTVASNNSLTMIRILEAYEPAHDEVEVDDEERLAPVNRLLHRGISIEAIVELESLAPYICTTSDQIFFCFLDECDIASNLIFSLEAEKQKIILSNLKKCQKIITTRKAEKPEVVFKILIEFNASELSALFDNTDGFVQILFKEKLEVFKNLDADFWNHCILNKNNFNSIIILINSNYRVDEIYSGFKLNSDLFIQCLHRIEYLNLIRSINVKVKSKDKVQERIKLEQILENLVKRPDNYKLIFLELCVKLPYLNVTFAQFKDIPNERLLQLHNNFPNLTKLIKSNLFDKLMLLTNKEWNLLIENKRVLDRLGQLIIFKANWSEILEITEQVWGNLFLSNKNTNDDINDWIRYGAKIPEIISLYYSDKYYYFFLIFREKISSFLHRKIPFTTLVQWITSIPDTHKFVIIHFVHEIAHDAASFEKFTKTPLVRMLKMTQSFAKIHFLQSRNIPVEYYQDLIQEEWELFFENEYNWNIIQEKLMQNQNFLTICAEISATSKVQRSTKKVKISLN